MLLSGGLDSAATVAYYRAKQATVTALFVDYGQAARVEERCAASHIADHFGIGLQIASIGGLTSGSGTIVGRNAALSSIALWKVGNRRSLIGMGIRDTELYPDCGPRFLNHMNTIADMYTGGLVRFAAPLLQFSKQDVIEYAAGFGVSRGDVHSCDLAGATQCGECSSCQEYA